MESQGVGCDWTTMVFPVTMYGYESWTIMKLSTEEWMLSNCGVGEDSWESLWSVRRSNPLILMEINVGYSLERLMLRLQYFGHLIRKAKSLEKTWCQERLRAGGEEGDRGWDDWMASLLNGHEFEQAPGDDEGQGSLACCSPWGHKESETTEWLNNKKSS